MNLQVLGADVSLGSQEHLDVLAGGVENAGQVGGSHDCRYGWMKRRLSSRSSQSEVRWLVGGCRELRELACLESKGRLEFALLLPKKCG